MGAEVVYDAIDQIMQAAAIVLESDNAMRTCNAAYLTAGGISTLLAIIEHHAGLQGDNQLKSFASLGIPDARSSSSRLPAPSMQILVETLKVGRAVDSLSVLTCKGKSCLYCKTSGQQPSAVLARCPRSQSRVCLTAGQFLST